ncbi:hypothetical protein AQUCO_05300128v1 [Aquilegia coerulea]|uniref:Protein ENDOSPERM DEFECTIVE 1 n=1 Tax=Aquilegia coerulea TaxID=218851 RepID=A0A2G5CIK2_AQUCA|nr:hypothetical protein AQUCO_05300128v1 [Aquilegia coerulea]
MAKVCAMLPGPNQQQQQHDIPSTSTPAMPPPRRPRVREVSSRFMSPIVSSSSSGDLHVPSSKHAAASPLTTSLHHPHQQQRSQSAHRREMQSVEPLSYADENRLETARSLDTPFGSLNKNVHSLQKKQQQQHCDGLRSSCNNKLGLRNGNLPRSRPDTPIVHSRDRMSYRAHNSPRSTKIVTSAASTDAAKLVQMSGMTTGGLSEVVTSKCVRSLNLDTRCMENFAKNPPLSDSLETKTSTIADEESKCNSPVRVRNSKMRTLPDVRSSMPETDLLPSISSKLLAHSRDTPKISSFPCYRSLSSPLPSCEQQSFPGTAKSVYRPSSSGTCLPPHPSNAKVGAEGKKATKVSNQVEQVCSLRLLHNQYLQWRFANAKAEAAMNAQSVAAKKSLHATGARISELRDSVHKKRTELIKLKKEQTLSVVLEAQVPYLDEWSTVEDEYSTSLAGAINALRDTSLRLPIIGNVKADIEEVGGALKSASNVMELMSSHVEKYLPKGEEMATLILELAEVVNRERAMVYECGDLLSKTHSLQMIECSLRSQLLQLKRSTSHQANDK